ncbi:MAG: hypothetical protein ACRD4O_10030 [Bryobacteraceae bacterium]
MPGPNAACVLAIAGILGIYAEGIRPGRVLPGVLGAAALIAGAYSLYGLSPVAPGLALIAASAVLFGAEALWDSHFLCGASGTAALAAGLRLLFGEPRRIALPLGIVMAAILGIATIFLAAAAKRARRNKRSDIGSNERA